ncbi:MAG: hypothetical protein ACK4RK_21395 [Gemmataceae bacterium]
MLTTLAFAAALSLQPAQVGQLSLANDRLTYGLLGPTRPDAKVLPGDILYVSFDIQNITVSQTGDVSYAIGMEVLNRTGQTMYKQDPQEKRTVNSLGGNSLPAFAHVFVGLDLPPGAYTLRVTVNDVAAKTSAVLNRPFEVLPPDFGMVRLQLSSIGADTPEQAPPAPPFAAPGQSMWVSFGLVGFSRDSAKNPNLTVEMRVLDATGKPTLPKPFVGAANKGVPENLRMVPLQMWLNLNRPGNFTIELKATDQMTKKTATMSFPIQVIATK